MLTPQIITLDILNILFLLFGAVAFYESIRIVLLYNADATTPLQYKLEKESYLVATIIKFIFYIKIPLFIFFIFTLDKISNILPGAMCAAGVVNATEYGSALLILKIINLYLFGFWLVLNQQDMHSRERKYIRMKFFVYIFAYILLVVEILSQIVMFFSIDPTSVVDCCGAVFSTSNGTYMAKILSLKPFYMLSLFYGIFMLVMLGYAVKNRYLFSFFNLLFLIVSIMSLISFFGTYIYELPSHHCPFCLLQKDYNYIGYLLYIILFLGTFYGIVIGLIRFEEDGLYKKMRLSLLFDFLYLVIVSYYPLSYYLKNGVWL